MDKRTMHKEVVAWLTVKGLGSLSAGIEVPESCFDDNGEMIEEDVIEYVEEWVQEMCRWGAKKIDGT